MDTLRFVMTARRWTDSGFGRVDIGPAIWRGENTTLGKIK